ncbi:MAG: hypothetical protein B7X49_13065 [Acidiphilium sp. 34-64-41]|nr:MAG: hypothetical protein B7X49_13065 [Acidiphilium sp. 34-64-41]
MSVMVMRSGAAPSAISIRTQLRAILRATAHGDVRIMVPMVNDVEEVRAVRELLESEEELGISKSIWGDACLAMGREQVAIAVAIVSAKPQSHFRGSAGAYFHGMVSRAKKGELHLARTICGMRAQH